MPQKTKWEWVWSISNRLRAASPLLAGVAFACFLALASSDRLQASAGFAWPAAAVVLAFLLREPLGGALARLVELTWGDKSAKFERGRTEKPEDTAPAATLSPLAPLSLDTMSPPAKKILATLWHYQQGRFPDSESRNRWTLLILPQSPFWQDYFIGGGELLGPGLIGSIRPDGRVFLTDMGVEFCLEHSSALASEDRIVFPDG